MAKRITAMHLRNHLGQVMNEVHLKDDCFVVERDGKGMAALVPLWKLEQMEERKKRFWGKVDSFRRTGRNVKRLDILIGDAAGSRKAR